MEEEREDCCPDCGGEVACECKKEYTWRCVEITGRFIGCGWTGEEPEYVGEPVIEDEEPLSVEELLEVRDYLRESGQASK